MAARPPSSPVVFRRAGQHAYHRPLPESPHQTRAAAPVDRADRTGAVVASEPPMRVFGRRVRTFESFREPAFRWFFVSTLGQMYSAIGQMFVRSFLVYELTDSYAAMGLVALVSGAVQFALGPYGGVLADRFPKKSVTQIFQFVGFLNAFIIGTLAILGILEFWHLLISAVSQGILVALMVPARQAMVSEIVSRERIMNGVALNTAAMNIMQFAAPLIGGVLLATAGAGVTFYVMAGCYALAIVTMLPIPTVAAQAGRGGGGLREAMGDIVDGFRYIAGHRVLRMILLLSFCVSVLGMPFQGLLPGFVQDAFDAGPALAALFMTFCSDRSVPGGADHRFSQAERPGQALDPDGSVCRRGDARRSDLAVDLVESADHDPDGHRTVGPDGDGLGADPGAGGAGLSGTRDVGADDAVRVDAGRRIRAGHCGRAGWCAARCVCRRGGASRRADAVRQLLADAAASAVRV